MLKFKFLNKRIYKPVQPYYPRSIYSISGGQQINELSAMQVSAFHRGLIYISTTIAKLPWLVKDKDNNIQDGSLHKLLNIAPNNETNAFFFRLFMTQIAIIHGNAYAEIERDRAGRPLGLWLIMPHHVMPYRTEDGDFYYRIIGGGPGRTDVFIPPQDMFHLRNFHTRDGINGEGVVAYARETLGIGLGADSFANSLFANGGMPSGTVSVPGALKDDAYKRMKASWHESHGGRQVGGIAILEEGAKYEPISHDPQVLQFLESRKFTVQEIARFLGVPPQKLFDPSAQTFKNTEQANLEVITDTIDAWTRNYEIEADNKLLSGQRGGRKTEFDITSVFRADMKTRSDYFNKMMQSAAMTPNQIRIREGLAPYEGGDRYYIANNNFAPADRIDELLDSQISKNETDSEVDETEAELNQTINNKLKQIR